MTPTWLPSLMNTDGVWEDVLLRLYRVFYRDFIQNECLYNGLKVINDDRKIDSPYEEGFWHLITRKDQVTKERFFDPPRAQKMPWCRPCIENNQDVEVLQWDIVERGRKQTYIWLEKLDYVIVLQKRTRTVFLVTAYFVDGNDTRRKLRKSFAKRII